MVTIIPVSNPLCHIYLNYTESLYFKLGLFGMYILPISAEKQVKQEPLNVKIVKGGYFECWMLWTCNVRFTKKSKLKNPFMYIFAFLAHFLVLVHSLKY